MKCGVSSYRFALILATSIMVLLGSMLFVEAQTNVVAAALAATTAPGAPTQTAPAQDTVLPNMLSTLNVWVAWIGAIMAGLSILFMVLLAAAGSSIYLHYRQGAKAVEEAGARIDKKLAEFEKTHDIAKLETPDKIREDMRRELEPRIEAVRARMQNHDEHFTSKIDGIAKEIQSLEDQLTKRLTIEQMLVEMDKKYRPPQDLQEKLLGRVLDAFLQVKELNAEEREAIRRILRADRQDGMVVDPPTSPTPKVD